MSEKIYQYDAFLSYRHKKPDKLFAKEIARRLEALGLNIAIDYKDFAPNKTFLEETERCINKSQFTLIVATQNYFSSGNTVEEAIICKVLDMEERNRRLVPLKIDQCDMPVWLYSISGINFMIDEPNPYDRLIDLFYSESRQNIVGGAPGVEKNVAGERLVSKSKAKEIIALTIGGVALGALVVDFSSKSKAVKDTSESVTDDVVEEGSSGFIGKIIDWL